MSKDNQINEDIDVVGGDPSSEEYGPDVGGPNYWNGNLEGEFDEAMVMEDGPNGDAQILVDYDNGVAVYQDEEGTFVSTPGEVISEAKKRNKSELDGSELEPSNDRGFFERVVDEVDMEDDELERQRRRYSS